KKAALPGWSAGRRNAPSRPHEERRERGDPLANAVSAAASATLKCLRLNQLSSHGTPTQPHVLRRWKVDAEARRRAVSGRCQPRTQAPPARSVAIRPPPRAMMRNAV